MFQMVTKHGNQNGNQQLPDINSHNYKVNKLLKQESTHFDF